MIKTLTHTIPSLSGTFGIPSRLALNGEALTNTFEYYNTVSNPKMPKEPSSPSRSNALSAYPDKTKISDELICKYLMMNKVQYLTQYIKHLAENANFKGSTLNKHSNGLIGIRFEMPNDSCTQQLLHLNPYLLNHFWAKYL